MHRAGTISPARLSVFGEGSQGAWCRKRSFARHLKNESPSTRETMRGVPSLSEHDVYLFREGTHTRLHDHLGCHLADGGAWFAVWAPNVSKASVIGDWNGWDPQAHPLVPRSDGTGIWQAFVPGARHGHFYKFRFESPVAGRSFDKADPFAVLAQCPPETASRAWSLDYAWGDAEWMARRAAANAPAAPLSIYEMHLGSWRRDDRGGWLCYREIADAVADHVSALGFTHVELLPVCEHPFYGSWGYQTTGYFAPTARYGTPQDFMAFVDTLHRRGIGVILDWVPSHFPDDAHGLRCFDGTFLYEHADPRQGIHPEWNSCVFNYGRHEVRAFLLSSARFWIERYHVDGLRVDAVASMLYLDYGRGAGEWVPNERGGHENLAAIDFLRALNDDIARDHPDVLVVAEESTAWPRVTGSTRDGGLGFDMKWNMGWMHDTLGYMQHDPIHRRHHHGALTFSMMYAWSERFVLPLSHDEVVHGKGSLVSRMPGDTWQQFASLRLLLGYMWAHPGKKLLFMGGEFGQRREWAHEEALEWWVLQNPEHAGAMRWVGDLNRAYREHPAMHALDFDPRGFAWVDCDDAQSSVLSFLRQSDSGDMVLVVCNFTPVPRYNHVLGVPVGGMWRELLNSDAPWYGGSGMGNLGAIEAGPVPAHGRSWSITATLPPLAVLWLVPEVRHD